MKKIPLTKGLYALVDDVDYPELSKYKWTAGFHNRPYRSVYTNGKRRSVYMYRQILGLGFTGHKRVVDHINHNVLDNRCSNLRVCTPSQNLMNGKMHKDNKAGFKGVVEAGKNTWLAYLYIREQGIKRRLDLGYYPDKIEAAKAYNLAAIKHFGQFAYLNSV